MSLIDEIWKDLADHNGFYQVSTTGKVKSFVQNIGKGKLLKPRINNCGYGRVAIDGKEWLIHRLVYQTHIGPLLPGLVIMHMDDNKNNNSISNLKQGTQDENTDMYKNRAA